MSVIRLFKGCYRVVIGLSVESERLEHCLPLASMVELKQLCEDPNVT